MGGGKQSTDNINSSVYNPPTYLFHYCMSVDSIYRDSVYVKYAQKKIILSKSDYLPFIFKHFHDQQDLQ